VSDKVTLVPDPRKTPTFLPRLRWAGAAAALFWLGAGVPAHAAPNAADAESQLKRIEARIHEVTATVQGDVARRDTLAADVHNADEALAAARQRLESVREKREACDQRRAELHEEQKEATATLNNEQEALAGQLRSAYMGGREEELKVLLNAKDPATLGRMLSYYGYLSNARADRLEAIRASAARLEAVEAETQREDARLTALEEDRRRELAAVESARQQRQRALGELQARIQKGSTELKDLKTNATALEDLLARLRAALQDFDSEDLAVHGQRRAFEKIAGHLPWPAHGKLVAQFGDARAAGLRWNGLLLSTHPGAEVRAPYFGRVVYADWLPGLGLLLILDHGAGYLSLYGYNDRLYRAVGDTVRPGELIAASAPDGPIRPELYFEIRQGARPLDPRGWLKGAPRP
jgi:septal ring factor EnvC (AmiA/AmiB activator)